MPRSEAFCWSTNQQAVYITNAFRMYIPGLSRNINRVFFDRLLVALKRAGCVSKQAFIEVVAKMAK